MKVYPQHVGNIAHLCQSGNARLCCSPNRCVSIFCNASRIRRTTRDDDEEMARSADSGVHGHQPWREIPSLWPTLRLPGRLCRAPRTTERSLPSLLLPLFVTILTNGLSISTSDCFGSSRLYGQVCL